jgi:hypothetical protein
MAGACRRVWLENLKESMQSNSEEFWILHRKIQTSACKLCRRVHSVNARYQKEYFHSNAEEAMQGMQGVLRFIQDTERSPCNLMQQSVSRYARIVPAGFSHFRRKKRGLITRLGSCWVRSRCQVYVPGPTWHVHVSCPCALLSYSSDI